MKKVLYIMLLTAEILLGLLMLGWIYSTVGWIACVIILAVVAALLVPLIRRLKKSADEAERKKTLRHIALAVMIPGAVGIVLGTYVIISLLMYFG